MHTDDTFSRLSTGKRGLAIAMVLAGLIQVMVVVRSPVIGKDGITFIGIAKGLAHSPRQEIRASDQHPGFPAMILTTRWAVTRFIVTDEVQVWVVAGHLAAGVCGLAAILMVWLIVRRVFGARVAAIAALLFAVMPVFRQNASDVLSDTPHLLFYLMATWAAIEGLARGKWPWFLLTGAASGIAYWIRPEGLSVAIVTAGLLAIWFVRPGERSRRMLLGSLMAVIIAAGLVAWPYVMLKEELTSKKDPLGSSSQAVKSLPKQPAGNDAPAKVSAQAVKPSKERSFAIKLAFAVVRLIFSTLENAFRYVFVLPFVAGLLPWNVRKARREFGRLLIALAAFHALLLIMLILVAGYVSHRHAMLFVALSMAWMGSGMIFLGEMFGRLGHKACAGRTHAVIALLCQPRHCTWLLVAILMFGYLPRTLRPLHRRRAHVRNAASWLKSRVKEDDKVYTNSPYVPFYANKKCHLDGKREADIPELKKRQGKVPYNYAILCAGDEALYDEWRERFEADYITVDVAGVTGREHTLLILAARK